MYMISILGIAHKSKIATSTILAAAIMIFTYTYTMVPARSGGGFSRINLRHFSNHATADGPCSGSRDLLIGFAAKYDVAAIYRTLHAFHEATTGPHQHIALFVTLPEKSKALLAERFPRAHLLNPKAVINPGMEYMGITPSKIKNPAFGRYVFQAKWLSDHQDEYDKVIMSDIRDIALYGDPFEQINVMEPGVQAFTEIDTYREDPRWNQPWVRDCYGDKFLESIMDEKLTCCGTMAGTTGAVVGYLHAFLEEFKEKEGCHRIGTDTAIHVWIIHKILPNAQIVDSEHALIRHNPGRAGENQLIGEVDAMTGGMRNSDGGRFALIHQYDRHQSLVDPYHRRHNINLETAQFQQYLDWSSME